DSETLQALDRFRCGILHPLKDDQAVAWSYDAIVQDLELVADAKLLNLRFDQSLGRLNQALLHFANADSQSARNHQALLNHQFTEEMTLPRASTTVCAFVSRGRKQWPEYGCSRNAKSRH